MSEQPINRGEFMMLAARVEANSARLEAIDAGGTRGIGVLQLQITELAKDFAGHEKQHELAESRRVSARRWTVGAIIAAIAAVDGPLATLLLSRH